MIQSETIAAIATGISNSGIGIIRISGEEAFQIAASIFKTYKKKKIDQFESHHVYYGYIFDELEMIDEVLLIVMRSPKSFTKEDTIEINCHGGIHVMNRILDTVIKHGARPAEPGEFTKRAFLNGRIDLSEAEAVIDLIQSKNDFALNNSLKQLTGKLYDEISRIREMILYEIAFIESALDDPEHISLDGYPCLLNKRLKDIFEKIHLLISSFHDGKLLSEGVNTVIIGKPNVGKSSLLNILAGEDRAIVTDIAGTTRDIIKEEIKIDGFILNFVDTAGIRKTSDAVEKIGVERAIQYAENADLIIMLVDSSIALDSSDIDLFQFIKDKPSIIVLNKSDLNQITGEKDIRKFSSNEIVQISAKEETGIQQFKKKIMEICISDQFKYNDEVFITNTRQRNLLFEAEQSIKEVFNSINNQMSEDLYVIDLMNSYDCLGKIIGEQVEEDVVNEIFSKFCTGK